MHNKVNSILNTVLAVFGLFSLVIFSNFNNLVLTSNNLKNYQKLLNLEPLQKQTNLENLNSLSIEPENLDYTNYNNLPTENTFVKTSKNKNQTRVENSELEIQKNPPATKEERFDVEQYRTAQVIYRPESIVTPSPAIPDSNVEIASGGGMIGFVDSNINNNQTEVAIHAEIRLTFPTKPDPELVLNRLRFYPEVGFEKELLDDNKTIVITPNPRFSTDTNYIFGLKYHTLCSPDENRKCQDKERWRYAFHFSTTWHDTEVIGKTVQGRNIVAHFYGRQDPDQPKILLTGAVHGEEWKSGGLWRLRDWLDNNPHEIRNKGRQLIIVDEVNIDGARFNRHLRANGCDPECMHGRMNANGVNLNRNFPANWRPCNYTYLGSPASCGSHAVSEPETRAIVNLTLSAKPTHLITYHSRWPPNGMIFLGRNSNPKTREFAHWVADRTGYPVGRYDGPEVTGGGVPGDQAVWSETVGVRSLLIEARWRNQTDFNNINFPMYKALVRGDLKL